MNDDGFWIEHDVLTPQECGSLVEAIGESNGSRGKAGRRNLMSNSSVASIVMDSRLVRIAGNVLKNQPVAYRATVFDKSADSNWFVGWHQDVVLPLASRFESSEWGSWSRKGGVLFARAPAWALSRVVALRIHLDTSTVDNGPLRVISGSHRLGVLTSDDVSRTVRESNYVECAVPGGGVLAMRPLLIHSSPRAFSNATRRVLHIEYADSLWLAEDICLAAA